MPCDCQATYCSQCWDRSLASSLHACGIARCPSCRTKMHVEYDASCGQPLFRRATDMEDDSADETGSWRPFAYDALYNQARPRQIELLKQFGATTRLASAPTMPQHACPKVGVPNCACGCPLTRVSLAERRRKGRLDGEEEEVDQQVVCDLCERFVKGDGACIWTCDNGNRTVLHGLGYDICEDCFCCYTDIDQATRERTKSISSSNSSSSSSHLNDDDGSDSDSSDWIVH